MPQEVPDFDPLLHVLIDCGVDFIVVGGVSAVLSGAPVATFDLDIVHSRSENNVDRLMAALQELAAYYRIPTDSQIQPSREHFLGPGHHLLITRHGPLDVLGVIGKGLGFEELEPNSHIVKLDRRQVRVQSLESLIAVKEQLGNEKDRAMLPVLRATLEERRGQDAE